MSPSRLARWSFFAGAAFFAVIETTGRMLGWGALFVPPASFAGGWLAYRVIDRAAARIGMPDTGCVGRCGAGAGVTTWTSGLPRPICALPAGHLGWHRADNGCEWGIPRADRP